MGVFACRSFLRVFSLKPCLTKCSESSVGFGNPGKLHISLLHRAVGHDGRMAAFPDSETRTGWADDRPAIGIGVTHFLGEYTLKVRLSHAPRSGTGDTCGETTERSKIRNCNEYLSSQRCCYPITTSLTNVQADQSPTLRKASAISKGRQKMRRRKKSLRRLTFPLAVYIYP